MDRIFTFCVHFRHEKIKSKTSSGDRNARRIWGPRCSTRYHFSSSQARWLFYRRWNCQWGECLYRFQWHSIRLLRELVTTSVHGVMPFVLSTANRVSHLSLLSNSTPGLNRITEGFASTFLGDSNHTYSTSLAKRRLLRTMQMHQAQSYNGGLGNIMNRKAKPMIVQVSRKPIQK